jgi:hypothetical protein
VRRRVDPGGRSEKEFVGRASGRVAKNLVDTDEGGSANELLRLKQITKHDRGTSPMEVTVRPYPRLRRSALFTFRCPRQILRVGTTVPGTRMSPQFLA